MSTLTALQALNAVFSKEQAEVILSLIENAIDTLPAPPVPTAPASDGTYVLEVAEGEAAWVAAE